MSVVLADGDVIADGVEEINAADLDLDKIFFAGDDNRIPATLNGGYLDRAEAYIADGPFPDRVITETYLSMGQEWSAGELNISVLRSNGVDVELSGLWRGPWTMPDTADTADTADVVAAADPGS